MKILFYLIYNICFLLILLISSPYFIIVALIGHHGIKERLGFVKKLKIPDNVIWIHASSVGEVNAVSPLIKEFKNKQLEQKILLTVFTKTGRNRANQLEPRPDFISYLPLDFPPFIYNFIKGFKPEALLMMESEMWANLVRIVSYNTKHIVLINGRFSDKTFKRSKPFKKIILPFLETFEKFYVRTKSDKNNLEKIGINALKIKVLGDMKYSTDYKGKSFETFTKPPDLLIVVAGCTRDGEEEIILNVFNKIKIPNLRLIIAPRHPERFSIVEYFLKDNKLNFSKFSEKGFDLSDDILLLDVMGKLTSMYAISDIVFIGGSLFDFGGHNPLEPAYFGVPIISGRYITNAKESMESLVNAGGGFIVNDEDELFNIVKRLIDDITLRHKSGELAKSVVDKNIMIANLYYENIVEILKK